jgi:hypothetical protein
MEALTRLVSDSLARHGLDRPVDPRRLQWSRWFRCESPHSLLVVPSKPGIFAIAEEILDLGLSTLHGAAVEERRFSAASSELNGARALAHEAELRDSRAAEVTSRRMLAVVQFSEDDNMAYVLDRMFAHVNPMRSRLYSGNCFIRFVVVEDQNQRRTICAALNQWMRSSAEKASGLPTDFSSSLELASENVAPAPSPAMRSNVAKVDAVGPGKAPMFAEPHPDSDANKNLHCPHPLPSGF